jgi:hypothetical protein
MSKPRVAVTRVVPGASPSLAQKSLSQFLIELDRDRKASPEEEVTHKRLLQFFDPEPIKRREAARNAIDTLVLKRQSSQLSRADRYALALSWTVSTTTLPGYATLDERHVGELSQMIRQIEDYYTDSSRKRPLNFLLIAPPGSGKSHLIECVSQALAEHRVAAHAFNMATMSNFDELGTPLDEARNLKVADKRPLLFLDEFDASPANYGLLLPLLWDGKLGTRQRSINLGKAVIVMAGSSRLLPTALAEARSMRLGSSSLDGPNAKLVDLISRINGAVVNIPPLDKTDGRVGRPFDKVAIAVVLLKARFPKVRRIPLAILAFIGKSRFRYDVRSITCVIDHITAPASDAPDKLSMEHMPKALGSVKRLRESSLVYHLVNDADNAHGVCRLWKSLSVYDTLVPLTSPDIPTASDGEQRVFIDYALSVIDS